jgi:hypothetical protein
MKKHTTLNVLFACGILSAGLQSVNAENAREDFNYPDSTEVLAQAGGSGWANAWNTFVGNGSITAVSDSLTYPGIGSSGGKMYCVNPNGTASTATVEYRQLTTPLTTGTTTYFRLMAQNLNGGRRYFGMSTFDTLSTERMMIGQVSTYGVWTINRVVVTNSLGTNTLVSSVSSDAPALLVVKLEMLDGPERVTFWVNPDLSKSEDVSTAVGGQSYMTTVDFNQINVVRIGGGGYSATAGGLPTEGYLDEITISPVSPFAPTVTESFDYPDSTDILAQSGGTGWTNAWTTFGGNGSITTVNGSLSYPGINSSGGKLYFVNPNDTAATTTVEYRQLASPIITGTTTYFRLLAQNLNGGHRYFGLSTFDGPSTERILIGQGSTYGTWTVNRVVVTNALGTNTLVSTVSSSEPALLVAKLEMLDGPERVTFWVNPDLSKPEDVSTAVGGQSYLTTVDYNQISSVRIGGGGYSASAGGNATEHYLDEISISPISPFAPVLTAAKAGANLALSWPPQHLGWILQNCNGPLDSGTWLNVPGTGQVISTNYPAANPTGFYRLRQP